MKAVKCSCNFINNHIIALSNAEVEATPLDSLPGNIDRDDLDKERTVDGKISALENSSNSRSEFLSGTYDQDDKFVIFVFILLKSWT